MIAVLGVMLAAMALSVAAFAAASGDVHLSRNDQDQKRAYAAAEAGVQDYFFHLTQDNAYWTKCTSRAPAHPALNQLGASPLKTLAAIQSAPWASFTSRGCLTPVWFLPPATTMPSSPPTRKT